MTFTPAVPLPTCSAHRYALLVDAVAELDMAVLHTLITAHRAGQVEVHRAIEQVERSCTEVLAAYQAHLTRYQVSRRRRDVNRVLLILAQPPLIPITEVAR